MESKFYYGTSTKNTNIQDGQIAPSIKAWNRNYKKISVTKSIEAAKFYAERAVLNLGGEVVVYEVVPDLDPLRRNKTDWTTNKAKIIKALTLEEVEQEIANIQENKNKN